jgi:hypothetical protein
VTQLSLRIITSRPITDSNFSAALSNDCIIENFPFQCQDAQLNMCFRSVSIATGLQVLLGRLLATLANIIQLAVFDFGFFITLTGISGI